MFDNKIRLPRLAFTTVFVLSVLAVSALADSDQFDPGRQLMAEGQYEQALDFFRAGQDSIEGDRYNLGLAHFYAGVCLYQLNLLDEALSELRLSTRFIPKFTFPADENYPAQLAELYQQARREVLCTVEIRIATPEAIAFEHGGKLLLTYRLEDVVAGQPVLLEPNRYNHYLQAHTLVAGRVNSFVLVWATGLVDTSLTLRLAQPGVVNHYDWGAVKENSEGCYVDVDDRRVEFERQYYTDTLVTRLAVGDDPAVIALGVVEALPDWHKLLSDLRRNPTMRGWSKRLKIASAVGLAATATVSVLMHGQAEDRYDIYLEALPSETNQAYRDYEHRIALRNIFGGFALSFAVIQGVAMLTSPRNQKELLEDFESAGRAGKLSLDAGGNYVGLRYTYSF
ncbi:MAG: hypothetical protein JSU65_07900 [Candidatus Zixiibacteriota bacterium]|nr:MAG: hypothetical protein JSU65_07900 [candidate division Zixibacteria bacterium]